LAATTIDGGAEVETGAPLYEKVPMPGRPLSEEPASQGPARTKAKARMKLMVRILLSPVLVPAVPAVSLAI
jgi:hypothetical protein